MNAIANKIEDFIHIGFNIDNEDGYSSWFKRLNAFLSTAIDEKTASDFSTLSPRYIFQWKKNIDSQLGYLEGLVIQLESKSNEVSPALHNKQAFQETVFTQSKKVFIVHGHDSESKESTARFIEKIGLSPIILHEQPNSGRTIIEKFEVYSDVGFAVILLTPDDVGASADAQNSLKGRARQNVILELGYFMGKLSRKRVCALYKRGVEIPSDYQGVLYIELDQAGAWKTKVAQELVQAGFSIDLEGLLQT